jgi:hypothetical protein
MTAPDTESAETIRKQGNELYKLGKLAEGGCPGVFHLEFSHCCGAD